MKVNESTQPSEFHRWLKLAIIKGIYEGGICFHDGINKENLKMAGLNKNKFQKNIKTHIIRNLFYAVFFAEIERLQKEGYEKRLEVQKICKNINEKYDFNDLYKFFMEAIESRTLPIGGRITGIRRDTRDEIVLGSDDNLLMKHFGSVEIGYYSEKKYEAKLSYEERKFLFHTPLDKMLTYHSGL